MRLVISQPMFFPWVGLLEQWSLANVWVHYDDVQFSKGSFTNRVQFKAAHQAAWLTLPLRDRNLGSRINELGLNPKGDFRRKHVAQLSEAYRGAPFFDDMLHVVTQTYDRHPADLSSLCKASMRALAEYFDLPRPRELEITDLAVPGQSSQRVLDVCGKLGARQYLTGQGARNYLDHQAFEDAGIEVRYMAYELRRYSQLHGAFTPYVSALDLIANEGKAGRRFIGGSTISWREALAA